MDQNKQGTNSKNMGPKLISKANIKPYTEINNIEQRKKDIAAKGLKKYSQGYTINKLSKESINKMDSYVKVVNKSKNRPKRPNSSKKRKVATHEKRYSGNFNGANKPLLGNPIGLYNGNYGDRNS